MGTDSGATPQFVFEPFRLDPADERLWRGEESIHLGRRALEVLLCLVSRAGRLVTKEEILASVWSQTAVSEAVLTTAVREVRRALGDRAREPRYVETVHGRGYRFIAQVHEAATSRAASPAALPPTRLVGREAEERRLHEWLASALEGGRRVGFIAGEAGIGKTTLVETFLSEAADGRAVWIGRGQCIEHYGVGEAYLPVLEALVRLGHDPTVPVADTLTHHAPSWLPHLPALVPPGRRQAAGSVTPGRMLRELAEALEVLTAERPLILLFEDLHWSDAATLEWLGYVARRRDRARLLVLGTYRPVEALLHRHPLRRLVAELRQAPQCAELVLDYLDRESVEFYVARRCGDDVPNRRELAELLHRRTGGHPLFLATLVDGIGDRGLEPDGADGALATIDLDAIGTMVPASVRQFIEYRLELLPAEDRTILDAGSVAGDPFSVATVAAATGLDDEAIEARCDAWTGEGRFLVAEGTATWPDGRLAARYRFRHALFQEVLYGCISSERRARLHRLIGERLERAFGERADAVATELAMHFEQGRELQRAVRHLERAAKTALQRSAYAEAHRHLRRGLDLLERLPEDRTRLDRELDFSLLLGQVLMTTEGWGAEEVGRLHARMRVLCEQLGDESRLPSVVWGEMAVSVVRAELRRTQALSEELLEIARRRASRVYEVAARMELGGTALLLGDLAAARAHLRQAAVLYEPQQHAAFVAHFGVDLGVFVHAWEGHLLWQTGEVERAVARSEEALRRSRDLSHPLTRAVALAYAAMLHQFRNDAWRVGELARTTILHCTEHGLPYYLAWAEVLSGWTRTLDGDEVEGLGEMRRGLEVLQDTGGVRLPYYRALLAGACSLRGRFDEAFAALDQALAEVTHTGERWWLAELHRLRGELLRARGRGAEAEAEACFSRAMEVARAQGSTMLELRAAESLARSWSGAERHDDAARMLAEVRERLGLAAADG